MKRKTKGGGRRTRAGQAVGADGTYLSDGSKGLEYADRLQGDPDYVGQARGLRSGAIGARDLDTSRARRLLPCWRKRFGERDGPWAALVMRQWSRWSRALGARAAKRP